MNDYSELKRLATAVEAIDSMAIADETAWMRRTTGEKVLLLIEELEELRENHEHVIALNHKQFGDAIRNNAERDQLKAGAIEDLRLRTELMEHYNQLKAENEALRREISLAHELYPNVVRVKRGSPEYNDIWLAWADEQQAMRKDAKRYRWLRDKSEAVHNFYISVPLWFKNVTVERESVDAYIDSAISQESTHD